MRRVLVVDDDDDIRLLLEELLRGAGYVVETARDGRDALRTFHANPTDIVVLDLSMPELDGFETLDRLRDLSDVPVILLTARGGEIDKVRGFRAGADDYVVKPFGRQELLARIEALLRRVPEATHLEQYDDGTSRSTTAGGSSCAVDCPSASPRSSSGCLSLFWSMRRQVLSADQLIEHVWGHAEGVSRDQVKLYVSYLRKKLGRKPKASSPSRPYAALGIVRSPERAKLTLRSLRNGTPRAGKRGFRSAPWSYWL